MKLADRFLLTIISPGRLDIALFFSAVSLYSVNLSGFSISPCIEYVFVMKATETVKKTLQGVEWGGGELNQVHPCSNKGCLDTKNR